MADGVGAGETVSSSQASEVSSPGQACQAILTEHLHRHGFISEATQSRTLDEQANQLGNRRKSISLDETANIQYLLTSSGKHAGTAVGWAPWVLHFTDLKPRQDLHCPITGSC